MKYPHCGETVIRLLGREVEAVVSARGVRVIMLYCPHCEAVLGALNKPKD